HGGELEELDLPRGTLDRHAGTRQPIERLAVALQRRVHRGYLPSGAEKSLQNGLEPLLPACRHRRFLHDRPLTIPGGGPRAESDREPVTLAAGKDLACDLRRLAEAKRQHAGRERVEAARVSGLAPAEEAAHALQRHVG